MQEILDRFRIGIKFADFIVGEASHYKDLKKRIGLVVGVQRTSDKAIVRREKKLNQTKKRVNERGELLPHESAIVVLLPGMYVLLSSE